MLGSLNVDLNDLKHAKEAAASYPRILAAIYNLEELQKVLEVYGFKSIFPLNLVLSAVISIIPVLFFPDIHSEAENRS